MTTNIELAKPRDFGEIINDTFIFVRQNFKPLLKYFFIFCGFFLLAAAGCSILMQINMLKAVNSSNTTNFGYNPLNPLSIFTPAYFLYLLFLLLEYLSVMVMVLCFMSLYKQNQNQAPGTEQMWGYFKFYFLRIMGSSFVITLLLIIGFIFCFVPGIYLYPIMALVFPIIIMENASFKYAFNYSFKLIKDNWWATFGVLLVMAIVLSVASSILVLPSALFTMGSLFLHMTKGTTVSLAALVITSILKEISHIFQVLSVVTTCLVYYNLSESKEGTGLMERINQFGKSSPDSSTTPEEY